LVTQQQFDALALKHVICKHILTTFGYPPIWKRNNNFTTWVQIILEQQVSLASANASYYKLVDTFGALTPKKLVHITDTQFKQCYVSRQKASYIRYLSEAILLKKLQLNILEKATPEMVYNTLIQLKGIGKWSIEVYMMMVLHYPNILPLGDIALMNEIKYQLQLHNCTQTAQVFINTCEPYKTATAFLLYWSYINRKKITLPAYLIS
jgi:DNA-3-methyladenine glycosylase II